MMKKMIVSRARARESEREREFYFEETTDLCTTERGREDGTESGIL